MELQEISMDRIKARAAYVEYRNAVMSGLQHNLDEARQRQLDSDRALRDGYKQLSMGRQLIRLSETMVAGGRFPDGMPKLSIMRADIAQVHCRANSRGEMVFRPNDGREHRQISKVLTFKIPLVENVIQWSIDRQATVPTIPPALRPATHPRNFHILWEVAEWAPWQQPRSRGRSRVGDPALLHHLRGDMWAVLAVWDLTELEKAALENGAVLS